MREDYEERRRRKAGMAELRRIEEQVDALDPDIRELFLARMELCRDEVEAKKKIGKPVYNPEREEKKLEQLTDGLTSGVYREAVRELFTQIETLSRRYQYQYLRNMPGTDMYDLGFTRVEDLDTRGKKIAYPGLPGAYSHAAALRFFGRDADLHHVRTFENLMEELESGAADYVVMPIENSTAGTVSGNYDLLCRYPDSIVAEVFLPVNHCLLAVPGAKLEDIRQVNSHAQSLMQCADYLSGHRWKQNAMVNNAVAAKTVAESGDRTQAASASRIAGDIYHLDVLEEGVNDQKDNTTRFLILTKSPIFCRDASRISLCFEVEHTAGSLYNALGNLVFNNINMSMLQSRPIPEISWEYRFFADIDGNLDDPGIRSALAGLFREAKNVRILGNY